MAIFPKAVGLSRESLPDIINEEGVIESLFIEIVTTVGKNIIVGTIYRPPNGKFEIFETSISKILTKIDKSKKITYLMGDFNIDPLKTESCDISDRFSEQLFTSAFLPLITRPARITEHSATLIIGLSQTCPILGTACHAGYNIN